MGQMQNKISSFQLLRGLAALLIITEHVRFLPCGAFGVDIFFVLCGYMAMYSTEKGCDGFLTKRIIRIVPLYWLMTLVTFFGVHAFNGAFISTRGGVKELLMSLFFIPFDMNTGAAFVNASNPVIQPLMRIGWTLNLEMMFYVVFFLAAKVLYKFRAVVATAILIILVIPGKLFGTPAFMLWGNPIVLEFSFGMLAYYIAKRLSSAKVSKRGSAFAGCLAVLILIFTASVAGMTYFDDYKRVLVWGIPMFAVILLAYLYDVNLKTPKVMVWLGDISFSVYLVHYYIVMSFDRYIFDFSVMSVRAWLGFAAAVFVTVVVSYFIYVLIERKLSSYLRSRLVDKK